MDQLLEFFKEMSPLQRVMLAGAVIIGWPVVRDNLFKSTPAVVDVDDDEEEEIIEPFNDQEAMESYWFLLYQACTALEDEQAAEEVRQKLVDISKHIF